MSRKRERFERSDVPRPSALRSAVAAVVCVVVLAGAAGIAYLAWTRATLESHLGDSALADAVAAQASFVVPDGGYVASTDEHECVLLLSASSLDEGATLESAQILAINTTQGTASLANVPLDARVGSSETPTTLSELFSTEGAAAVVEPVASAANVSLSHVIVSAGNVLSEMASVVGTGPDELLRSASGLLSRMRTDCDAERLISLAERVSSVGAADLSAVDAPLVPETTTDDEGNVTETGYQVIDRAQLGLALGLLVPAA